MNLDTIPAIDTHAHPFPVEQKGVPWSSLRDAVSVALRGSGTPDINDTMMLSRMLLRRLARLLGTEQTPEAVTAARNALAEQDILAYHTRLWDDANIRRVLIDPGYPLDRTIEADEFATVMPCPVNDGYRIERFAAGKDGAPFDYDAWDSFADLVEAFRAKLDDEAAKPGMVFYKSIVAYRTGLRLTWPSEAEALRAWKARPGFRHADEKVLRDYLFRETALKALEHDLAFQVHTGHTSDGQPWPNANPIEMTLFLNQAPMDEVRFVLVHGGYPFNTEAGYITSVFPNIYLDLSLMIPWSSIGIAQRIHETLESAPTGKVMYGSDGIMVPELFWLSAHNARTALGKVLDEFIADDLIDDTDALEIANDVMWRTATRVYGVGIDR